MSRQIKTRSLTIACPNQQRKDKAETSPATLFAHASKLLLPSNYSVSRYLNNGRETKNYLCLK